MDFGELRARITRSHAATDRHLTRSPEAGAALKRERARQCSAKRIVAPPRPHDALDVLVLVVSGERLAVPVSDVLGVVRRERTNVLPLVPPHLPFVIGFRGDVVPCVALHVLRGDPVPAPTASQRLVVVRPRSGRAALLVDEAVGVVCVVRSKLAEHGAEAWLPPGTIEGVTPEGVTVINVETLIERIALASGGGGLA